MKLRNMVRKGANIVPERAPVKETALAPGPYPSRKRRIALAKRRGTIGSGGVSRESQGYKTTHPIVSVNKRRRLDGQKLLTVNEYACLPR